MAKKKSGWDVWREKKEREAKRNIKKTVRKTNTGYFIVAVIFIAVGLVAGYYAASFLTKNDCFELVGSKETVIMAGSDLSYTDEGIKYISMGKDISTAYTVETNLTRSGNTYTQNDIEPGEYYIIYTVTEGRCKGMTLYRVFTVEESGGTD